MVAGVASIRREADRDDGPEHGLMLRGASHWQRRRGGARGSSRPAARQAARIRAAERARSPAGRRTVRERPLRYRASSSLTQPSRKRRKPLPSRLGFATQWPQGEA